MPESALLSSTILDFVENRLHKILRRAAKRTEGIIWLPYRRAYYGSPYTLFVRCCPKELKRNGAAAYYGRQQSAASVEDSGKELAARIR